MPPSTKNFRNKLSGAIQSLLPRSDGHFAYDSGWDDCFEPVEDLPSGKQNNIQKAFLSQTETGCRGSRCNHEARTGTEAAPSDPPQLTLAQVRQHMLQVGKTASTDVPPAVPPKVLRINLNTRAASLAAHPEVGPDYDGESSTCPSVRGASDLLQLDTSSECTCSSCTLV